MLRDEYAWDCLILTVVLENKHFSVLLQNKRRCF